MKKAGLGTFLAASAALLTHSAFSSTRSQFVGMAGIALLF